jgi:hypothetical protein
MTSLLGMLLGSLGTSSGNVPGAPGIGAAGRLDNTSVTVQYTAPASDGGSPITKYTAVSTPGGITGTLNQAGSGVIIVSGLTTGTAYTFVVYATNSAGNSANSAASNSATPAGLPGTPTIGTATATGTTTATVSFTAPSSDNGSAITSYTAVSTPGNITGTLSQSGSGTISVSGLTSGTAYTFQVYATNGVGNSFNYSGNSNSITTYSLPVNTVAPAVTGTATRGQTLSTTTGSWTGTPASFSYAYQWQRSEINIGSANSSTYTLVTADVGRTIRCLVTATNAAGSIVVNSNSTAAVAAVVPSAPTIGAATATGASTATVAFTAPADNGGATITSYTAVSSPGGITGTLSQSGSGTITVSGLNGNTGYTFVVRATNSAGNSPDSGSSNSITTSSQLYQAYFNATTNTQLYVGVSGSSIAANQNFTVECWGYRLNSNTHNFWSIGTETTGRLQLQATLVEVFGGAFTRGFTAPSINAWHHYALVRNSNAIQLYVDGTARLSAGSYSNALGNTGPVYIGTRSNGNINRLNGYMSNFRIVIGTAVYTGTFTPPRTNLPAISGTSLLTLQNSSAIDNSGNNRTITNTQVTFSTLSGY